MKLMKKLENLFAASAFAEEGEFDTARQMAAEEVAPESSTERAAAGTPAPHHPHTGTVKPSRA